MDNHDVYLYKDYGVNYFQNFTHNFEFEINDIHSTPSVNKLSLLSYTSALGDVKDLKVSNEEALFFVIRDTTNDFIIRMQEINDGSAFNYDTGTLSLDTLYYCTFSKTGTTVSLSIYSDSNRSNSVTSASATLQDNWSYRYLTAPNSMGFNDGDNGNDGYIQNLSLE